MCRVNRLDQFGGQIIEQNVGQNLQFVGSEA
jgi:hypothetical protein